MELFENIPKLIVDKFSVPIFVLDQNYKIVDLNCAFEDLVKLSREKIIGEPCYKLTHNSDIPCWEMKDIICPAKIAFKTNERCRTIHKHFISDKILLEEIIATPLNNGQFVLEEFRNLSDLLGLDQGVLSICAWCKKVRDNHGDWYEMEGYLHNKTGTDISHSICPECSKDFNRNSKIKS